MRTLASCSLLLTLAGAATATQASGGLITFSGSLTNDTCVMAIKKDPSGHAPGSRLPLTNPGVIAGVDSYSVRAEGNAPACQLTARQSSVTLRASPGPEHAPATLTWVVTIR
jgi:type 1 fimbria pilin